MVACHVQISFSLKLHAVDLSFASPNTSRANQNVNVYTVGGAAGVFKHVQIFTRWRDVTVTSLTPAVREYFATSATDAHAERS